MDLSQQEDPPVHAGLAARMQRRNRLEGEKVLTVTENPEVLLREVLDRVGLLETICRKILIQISNISANTFTTPNTSTIEEPKEAVPRGVPPYYDSPKRFKRSLSKPRRLFPADLKKYAYHWDIPQEEVIPELQKICAIKGASGGQQWMIPR